jgi:hypothetical protein
LDFAWFVVKVAVNDERVCGCNWVIADVVDGGDNGFKVDSFNTSIILVVLMYIHTL